jgi:protease-4
MNVTAELPPDEQKEQQPQPTEEKPPAAERPIVPPPRPAPPPPPPPPRPAPPPPPPPKSGRRSPWGWGCGCGALGCLTGFIIAIFVLVLMVGSAGSIRGIQVGGAPIALVRVDGVIVAGESGFSPLGGAASGSDEIVDQIERAADDSEIKGILIRVNSPGGSAAGSQEIYKAVATARKRKPVVVSMADVAASGGYYISAAATEIWADSATITGSIGVISSHEDISGLFAKIGVKPEILKAGKFKDMGSPYGPLSPEVRALIENLLKETHEEFIAAVADGRKESGLTLDGVRTLADGRIYSGKQAKANKLVDQIGGMSDALASLGRRAGVSGKPTYKSYGPSGFLRKLFGGAGSSHSQVIVTGGLLYDEMAARLALGALQRQRELESAGK